MCLVLYGSSPLSVICSHKLFLHWLNFQNLWVRTFLLWLLILIMVTAGRRDSVSVTKQAGFIIRRRGGVVLTDSHFLYHRRLSKDSV